MGWDCEFSLRCELNPVCRGREKLHTIECIRNKKNYKKTSTHKEEKERKNGIKDNILSSKKTHERKKHIVTCERRGDKE